MCFLLFLIIIPGTIQCNNYLGSIYFELGMMSDLEIIYSVWEDL